MINLTLIVRIYCLNYSFRFLDKTTVIIPDTFLENTKDITDFYIRNF